MCRRLNFSNIPALLSFFFFFVWFCGSSFVTCLSFCLISFSPLCPPSPPPFPPAQLSGRLYLVFSAGASSLSPPFAPVNTLPKSRSSPGNIASSIRCRFILPNTFLSSSLPPFRSPARVSLFQDRAEGAVDIRFLLRQGVGGWGGLLRKMIRK